MKQHSVQVLLLFIILIFPSVVHLPQDSIPVVLKNGTKDWTVMLYFCADTRNSEVVGVDNSGNSVDTSLSFVLNHLKNDLASGSQTELNVMVWAVCYPEFNEGTGIWHDPTFSVYMIFESEGFWALIVLIAGVGLVGVATILIKRRKDSRF